MDAELIRSHFPEINERQYNQFVKFGELFRDWNSKINLVSRKDIDQLFLKHVLHSLGIAKVMPFADGSQVLDIGTGGGFPGLPLAILYPKCHFTLVDSIGKKIMVVNDLAAALHLDNVKGIHERAENIKGSYDFIVSRAVTRLNEFVPLTQNKFKSKQINAFPNGILYLKGGDLSEELREVKRNPDVFPLSKYFTDPFFETKVVVYIRMV
jgi:16S rRNA (guanine527-N7)-methyltransferase